jgi:hypothetical protein
MRQVVHAVNVRYKGQPTVSVSVDGVYILEDQMLPEHNVLKSRRIALPEGGVGYTPQFESTFTGSLIHQFETVSEQTYSGQQLFHFFEVNFSGTVELEMYVDEVRKSPNNSDDNTVTLTARSSRKIDTRRVYFPPLSYGWVPQLKHVGSSSLDGQVYSSRMRALPPRFFKGEREHSEIQVTHQGSLELEVYLDGKLTKEYRFGADKYKPDAFKTEKEYLPSGSRGQILQWIQSDGDGEVASFESDITLTDMEQPQQEV